MTAPALWQFDQLSPEARNAAPARGATAQRRDHIASALEPGDLKKAQARAAQLQQTIQTGVGPTNSQKTNAATP